jgi:hypothetical protein
MFETQVKLKHAIYVPIVIQQYANINNLFISVNWSLYFGWYLHPSSEAHVTVSTASGISKTVTATPSNHVQERLYKVMQGCTVNKTLKETKFMKCNTTNNRHLSIPHNVYKYILLLRDRKVFF